MMRNETLATLETLNLKETLETLETTYNICIYNNININNVFVLIRLFLYNISIYVFTGGKCFKCFLEFGRGKCFKCFQFYVKNNLGDLYDTKTID